MTTTKASLLIAAISLIAGSTAGRAQQAAPEPTPLARLEQALDKDTYRAVAQVIDSARARSLPVDPLVDRALEGALKRAPAARIRAAVSLLAQRLEVARTVLAPSPTPADIAAGAGALGVGVPRETLQTIRSIQPHQPVAVPLGVLTELVARSVPVDRAAKLVVELLRKGATATQLVALNDDVQRDIAAGIEPGAAIDLRTHGVASTSAGGVAATGESANDGRAAPASAGGNTFNSGNSARGGTRTPAPGSRRP
jgi:hypothetical protein